jgi:HlyD family secretion protein
MSSVQGHEGQSIHKHLGWVAGLCGLLLIVGVGWSALTQISGAVVAHGALVAASDVKKVQHASGGSVSVLAVHEGQKVREGQLLLRLDDTQTAANLAVFHNDLLQLQARRARLLAEQSAATGGGDALALAPGANQAELAPLLDDERRLMLARRLMRERQKTQIDQQIAGMSRQIEGLGVQAASHKSQIGMVNDELRGVRQLYDEGYAPISTLKGLERQAEALSGERGQLTASAAQASNRIAELKSQSLQIDAQHLSEVLTDLRDVEGKLAEVSEKEAAVRDQLRHIEIHAPQAGYVHQLAVHTIGGVITPGEPIMLIVPSDDALSVEAKVSPQSIDQIAVGKPARLKFSAFDRRTSPEIVGQVSRVSADLEYDQRSGAGFYLVRIDLPASEVARLGAVKLVPGMPVEVYVQTGRRTVLSYLLKPLRDQTDRAFTER